MSMDTVASRCLKGKGKTGQISVRLAVSLALQLSDFSELSHVESQPVFHTSCTFHDQ